MVRNGSDRILLHASSHIPVYFLSFKITSIHEVDLSLSDDILV